MPCAAMLLVSDVETDVVSIAVEKWLSGSRSARSAIGRSLPVAKSSNRPKADVTSRSRYSTVRIGKEGIC